MYLDVLARDRPTSSTSEAGWASLEGRVGSSPLPFVLAEAARSECAPQCADNLAAPLKARGENLKALARANDTSRRASGWAGEKVARREGQFWLPPCREDVCLEAPQLVHCAISRVDTHGQRVVAFPEFPTTTD
jgi:hypothetical protein